MFFFFFDNHLSLAFLNSGAEQKMETGKLNYLVQCNFILFDACKTNKI